MKQIRLEVFLSIVVLMCTNLDNLNAQIIINEFMAGNASNITDETGDYDDWVELFNSGTTPVNIANMYVSDTSNNPTLWRIPDTDPQKTTIPALGFLVLWFDKEVSEGILHVNAKLSADGEEIFLTAQDGKTILDQIQFGAQSNNVSFGRSLDLQTWGFMKTPTPNASNSEIAAEQKVLPPLFSVEAGFYDQAFNLQLQIESGLSGSIFYTMYTADISNPTAYSKPIIQTGIYSSPLSIDSSKVVRAYVRDTKNGDSIVITKTYFIKQHFSLPVVSLVTSPRNLFDETEGIYMIGPEVLSTDQWPYLKANYYWGSPYYDGTKTINSWADYEKPVHIEYFESNGKLGLSLDAGLEISGVWSRALPKKSFNIKTRGEYGVNEIDYPLFEDNSYTKYDGLTLRAGAEDRARINNEILYMAYKDMPLKTDMQAYKPAVLFINGIYWGIYSLTERKDDSFIKTRYNEKDIDLIADWGIVKNGSIDAYNEFINFLNNNDISDNNVYSQILNKIEVDNLIDHWILQIYASHGDTNNVRYWCPRTPDGKWHWISYDFDWWKEVDDTTFADMANQKDAYEWMLLGRMLTSTSFRFAYLNRLADFLNTVGNPKKMSDYIDIAVAQIASELDKDIERWKDWREMTGPIEYSKESYDWSLSVARDFVTKRPDYIRQQIVEYYALSGAASITITTDSNQGQVKINSIDAGYSSFSGKYFKGIPITISAIPNRHYAFTGWSGGMSSTNRSLSVTLQSDMQIKANFRPINLSDVIYILRVLSKMNDSYDDMQIGLAEAIETLLELADLN